MRDNQWMMDDSEDEDEDEIQELIQSRTDELYAIPDATPDEQGIITLPVIPMRDVVIFPRMLSPIFVGREISLLALDEAQENNHTLIALTQLDNSEDAPTAESFYPIGVEIAAGRLLNMPDGTHSTLVQGRKRIEVVEFIQTKPVIYVRARVLSDPISYDRETEALMRTVKNLFEKVMQLNESIPEEAFLFALNIEEPGWLADMVATSLSLPLSDRQAILAELNPTRRLQLISGMLASELDMLELEDEIQMRVQSQVDRSQREVYLREQMRAIQTELGEGDLWAQELSEIKEKIEKTTLPEEVRARATREMLRLSQMPPMSPEVGIIRTYIDWILDLPWAETSTDNLDLSHVAQVLNEHHYGLSQIKDRILEYIAVRSLNPKRLRQPILCFAGPPGTGKTSMGQSIARALGREFVRISLGGVRDEAEIRGHRRTYIGALPGRILQTMRRAGTLNPLFMLDEVDKLSSDYRGDPSSALLEVLDPEQNYAFSDHYLELPYDLSKVMFITTANWIGRIPDPLLDRMEVIEFNGYIEEEKIEICHRFLLKRQMEENGVDENELQITDQALQRVIREYTYESGVRNLEREIGRICRKVARLKAEKRPFPSRIMAANVVKLLGPPQFFQSEAERQDEVGVATALAWTENGGDIMPVEVLLLDGKGNLQLTGQIGDVMQESAQAGLSYLKSRASQLEIASDSFENLDIHLHIPEGSIPKDGPSAGITMATALISAFTRRKARKEVGMTGEITLRGRVLPVGGVREKVLAAHRSGIKEVILPQKNAKDLVDIPKKVRQEIKIILVDHMDQVLDVALHTERAEKEKTRATRRKPETIQAENTEASE